MSYLQPEQLTATAYVDNALQDYLFQLQHCTTDPAQAPPPNVDLSALSTIQSNGEAVMSQSGRAALDPQAAAAYNQEGLPSFAEQAMQQEQQQQDMGQQASANGKQSAVWVQRNRKNQKQYRIRQKVCMSVHEFCAQCSMWQHLYSTTIRLLQAQKQQMEEQVEEMAAQIEKLKVENTRIAGRNSTLETVLSFRGSEITNLQHRNQVRPSVGDSACFFACPAISAICTASECVSFCADIVCRW